MSISISIDQIRKSNLKKFIAEQGYKSLTEFAKINGFFASNLSPILNGNKKFTDKLAKTLEEKLKLPLGFFSRLSIQQNKEYLISFKTINKATNTMIDEGSCFGIQKDALDDDKLDPNSLFAIGDDFEIDRNALEKSLKKNSVLVFNSNDVQFKNNKIYLIKFSNQLLLRRYVGNASTGFLETDNIALYSKISSPSKEIEVLGRLVYQLNLTRF